MELQGKYMKNDKALVTKTYNLNTTVKKMYLNASTLHEVSLIQCHTNIENYSVT